MLVAGFIGLLLERLAFAPLRGRPDTHFSGSSRSLAMADHLRGDRAASSGAPNVSRFPFGTFPEAARSSLGVAIVSVCSSPSWPSRSLLFLGLYWLVQRTRLGRDARGRREPAGGADPRASTSTGPSPQRFFISSALGGAAGVLFGLAFNSISPDMGRASS